MNSILIHVRAVVIKFNVVVIQIQIEHATIKFDWIVHIQLKFNYMCNVVVIQVQLKFNLQLHVHTRIHALKLDCPHSIYIEINAHVHVLVL